jgi:hypothetical protein
MSSTVIYPRYWGGHREEAGVISQMAGFSNLSESAHCTIKSQEVQGYKYWDKYGRYSDYGQGVVSGSIASSSDSHAAQTSSSPSR